MAVREGHLGKGTIGYTGEDPGYLEAQRRRRPYVRAILATVMLLGGLLLVTAALLPSHAQAVTATVTTLGTAGDRVTVSAPDYQHPMTVAVDPGTSYTVGQAVTVTTHGRGSTTATLGDTHAWFVGMATGLVLLAGGLVLGAATMRPRRGGRSQL